MADRSLLLGIKRGLRLRCPECGEGRLYRKYLKVQSPCEVCGHDNLQYPSDDAPPYFTIFLVGHVVIAPMLFFNFIWTANIWVVLLTTLPLLFFLTLLCLPVVKGAVLGAMWALDFKRRDGVVDEGRESAPPGG